MSNNDIKLTKEIKRVAIVGCGNAAGYIDDDPKKRHIYSHAKAISMIKALKITACCDINKTNLKAYAKKWKIPGQYLDLQKMLREEKIDIFVIATPTELHYENVLMALSSGVEVIFCEKPLSFDFKSSIELVKKASELNKLLIVNYMRRWDLFYTECKNMLQSGELGRIETIVAYVDTALFMNSSHMLDMIIYFGGDIHSAAGYLDRMNEPRIVHGRKDYGGMATIKHKNGIITFLKATGESQRNHFFELDFQCTKGRLRILDDDIRYEVYKFKDSLHNTGLEELLLEYTKFNDNKSERLVNAYNDILSYIKYKKQPAFSATEALKSLELINLIYESDTKNHIPVIPSLEREL
ncbi:MAG: hypothetical protein C0415_06030 [Thermodesulfovibrio sp.]|nr:hypothetical protein [Thermodesulfovibrio sp.]